MTLSEDREDLLQQEAELLGRYLVGRSPGAELVERYVAASRIPLVGPASRGDLAVLRFIHRRPWALGCLDAAAGLLSPRCLLRRKAILMTAILEATPDHVEDFLPRPSTAIGFFLRCAWIGLKAMTQLGLGVLLWPLANLGGGVREERAGA